VPVPVPAGGILLFEATVFHAVGTDTDAATRIRVVLGCRRADELDAPPDRDPKQFRMAGCRPGSTPAQVAALSPGGPREAS
jgi:hypothetical protein